MDFLESADVLAGFHSYDDSDVVAEIVVGESDGPKEIVEKVGAADSSVTAVKAVCIRTALQNAETDPAATREFEGNEHGDVMKRHCAGHGRMNASCVAQSEVPECSSPDGLIFSAKLPSKAERVVEDEEADRAVERRVADEGCAETEVASYAD